MFDLHIHSKHSHDSVQTLDEICKSAIAKGVRGVAICDHVDMWFAKELETYDAMKACFADVRAAREKYGDRIKLLQGIEMAEYLFDPIGGEEILRIGDYDVILGSVHSLLYMDYTDSYSRLDFGEANTIEKINGFFGTYLEKIMEMIEKTDIDVLSHLTCPLRYINGKFCRDVDISQFTKEIDSILHAIIQKEIALEINTSGLGTSYDEWMPNREILKHYKVLGGKLITIGSDAHIPQNIGNAFEETKAMLREIGFSEYCYYEKRKPKFIKL